MTFSYTDDAIVSTSPTGRHLSTVIKRPCVLMSGWNEHADAVCKVLNDLSATAGVVSSFLSAGMGDYTPRKGKEPADVLSNNWPQMDYSRLEELAAKAVATGEHPLFTRKPDTIQLTPAEIGSGYDRVKWAEGLIRQLPSSHEGRNSWLNNYGTGKGQGAAELNKLESPQTLATWIAYGSSVYAFAEEQRKQITELQARKPDRRDELIEALEGELSKAHEQLKNRAEPTFTVRLSSTSGEQYRTTGAAEAFQLLSDALTRRTAELDEASTKLCAAQMLLEKPIELNGERLAALASMKPGACLYVFPERGTRQTLKRV